MINKEQSKTLLNLAEIWVKEEVLLERQQIKYHNTDVTNNKEWILANKKLDECIQKADNAKISYVNYLFSIKRKK
jgi:hypothetical protein